MKITGYRNSNGTAYRTYDLRILDENTAVGWLEDDFHHFGITVIHDGSQVTDIRMASPRTPWTACSGASEPLRALVGQPLITRASDIGELIEMRLQCTHVFDLTGLLLAHIANRHQREEHWRYLTEIPDRPIVAEEYALASFGPGEAKLYLNDTLVMHWEIDGEMITGPEPYGGHSQNDGFRAWTETLPELEAEYATILRRAIRTACGRAINSDDFPSAADMSSKPLCHAFQPEQRSIALRNRGNAHDYTSHPEDMLINVKEIP